MPLRVGSDAFAERVDTGLEDAFMRGAVRSAQERLRERKHTSSEQLGDWEAWRDHGEEIRTHTLNHLDYYLEQLSDNIAEMVGTYSSQKRRKKRMHTCVKLPGKKKRKRLLNQSRWSPKKSR